MGRGAAGFSGALGGLGSGASLGGGIGMMAGGPAGGLIGAGIGAGVGLLGGAIGGLLGYDADEEFRKELEAEMDKIEATREREITQAEQGFASGKEQAGAMAQEFVRQQMTVKNLSDQSKADAIADDASFAADSANLTPAEKADFVLDKKIQAEEAAGASSPAVYQAAGQSARQIRAQEIDKEALEYTTKVQSAERKFASGMQQVQQEAAGYESVQGQVGQAIGAIGQLGGAVMGAASISQLAGAGAGAGADAAAKGADAAAGGADAAAKGATAASGAAAASGATSAVTGVAGAAGALGGGVGDSYGPIDVGRYQELSQGFEAKRAQHAYDSTAGAYREAATRATPAPSPGEIAEIPIELPTRGGGSGKQAGALGGAGADAAASGAAAAGAGTDAAAPTFRVDQYGNLVDQYGNYSDPGPPYDERYPTSQQALIAGSAGVSPFASGGMAGTGGPEVALLGEEGPELVLNAKQTAELANALGSAKPLAQGGVAGGPDKGKVPGYAQGGVAGSAPIDGKEYSRQMVRQMQEAEAEDEVDVDELHSYLTTLTKELAGAV